MRRLVLAVLGLLCLISSRSYAQEHELAPIAQFLRAMQMEYDNAKSQYFNDNPFPLPNGTARQLRPINDLRHQAWLVVAYAADFRQGNGEQWVNWDWVQTNYAADFPSAPAPAVGPPGQGNRYNEARVGIEGIVAGVESFRNYSGKFQASSAADIAETLHSWSRNDPFRQVSQINGQPAVAPLDTIEAYKRQVDAVISAVEPLVTRSNVQYVNSGYRVAPNKRWAVYREAIRQLKEAESNASANPAIATALAQSRNPGSNTYEPLAFVQNVMQASTEGVLTAALGRTDLENERDFKDYRNKTPAELAALKDQKRNQEVEMP